MNSQVSTSTGASTQGGFSGDASEEEETDESSSSSQNEENIKEILDNFREEWQRELHDSPKHQQNMNAEKKSIRKNAGIDEDDREITARTLFLKGVEMERANKLYEAIQFYRRAVQIVPDIEFRLQDSKTINREPVNEIKIIKEAEHHDVSDRDSSDDEEDVKDCDLLLRIQKKLNYVDVFCSPKFDQQVLHISALPVEILLYIFRWVVSSDLDLRSLEMCSLVCRGFYVCARDSEIWRLACIRTWGVNYGNLPPIYNSWRQMFIERPRLHFNGCYISKTTYIRQGENSFQDQFYRPWHYVEYYRYIRFFPECSVLMLTTADEPAMCVGQLKSRNIRSPSVLVGHYRLKENRVTLFVKRQDQNRNSNQGYKRNNNRKWDGGLHETAEQTFQMELEIRSYNKKRHVQLAWIRYCVLTKSKGTETTCTFDLVTNRFPPLWFSRVKSYTAEAECPLQ